ncbi:MAG: helix-turn-helix domain-containing protein [Vicinamibacterales bacterium]
MSEGMTIGELARATGTKPVTVRYYERIGLLPAPRRSAGNYRVYEAEHRDRLQFVRRCRELGFALDQVRDLLRLASRHDQACDAVDRLTGAHLITIERKIDDLRRLAQRLRRIKRACRGGGTIADCRILDALASP